MRSDSVKSLHSWYISSPPILFPECHDIDLSSAEAKMLKNCTYEIRAVTTIWWSIDYGTLRVGDGSVNVPSYIYTYILKLLFRFRKTLVDLLLIFLINKSIYTQLWKLPKTFKQKNSR